MKVILVNGSSRKNGCTSVALHEVERALHEEGIDTETVFIGNAPMSDCLACRKCRELGRCVLDDAVNEFVEKAKTADGFVFGSLGVVLIIAAVAVILKKYKSRLKGKSEC